MYTSTGLGACAVAPQSAPRLQLRTQQGQNWRHAEQDKAFTLGKKQAFSKQPSLATTKRSKLRGQLRGCHELTEPSLLSHLDDLDADTESTRGLVDLLKPVHAEIVHAQHGLLRKVIDARSGADVAYEEGKGHDR